MDDFWVVKTPVVVELNDRRYTFMMREVGMADFENYREGRDELQERGASKREILYNMCDFIGFHIVSVLDAEGAKQEIPVVQNRGAWLMNGPVEIVNDLMRILVKEDKDAAEGKSYAVRRKS